MNNSEKKMNGIMNKRDPIIPLPPPRLWLCLYTAKGALVWDQSGIRITGITRVSVCLGAILIPAILLLGAE